MAYVPNSNSVVSFQSNPSVLQTLTGLMSTNASVITVGIAALNQSVSGTVNVGNFPTTQNVSGSVVAFQGAAPWANTNVGSVITVNQGSVAAVIIGGSIAASFTPPANQSVSGTVGASIIGTVPVTGTVFVAGSVAAVLTGTVNQSVSGTVGASIVGTVPVTQVTSPWVVVSSIAGGIFPISGSVAATVTNFPTTQNVSGSVVAFQGGTQTTSLVSTVPSSVIVGASIFGQLPAGTAMLGSVAAYQGAVWNIAGSVAAIVTNTVNVNAAGSVVAFQGTSPWVVNFQNSSVLAVPVGSVITVFQAPSIVGTYAEDAASASGDKGFLVMGARNDTLASVTSNDGDYSSHVVGPAGELISANAPFTKWVQGNTSIVSGGSVAVILAQGASIFTYITNVQISNTTAVQALVTFSSGSNSIIGYSTAPANGGSNIMMPNAWKTTGNAAVTASINSAASVFISMSGFISKT